MGTGIVDSAVDSIDSMRKVLICARSVPKLVTPPDKAVKVVVNAAIAAAVLLLVNRMMLYPPNGSDNLSESVKLVVINVLISLTSLLPVFIVSIVAIFSRPDDQAESTADRWLVIISFLWIMTLTTNLAGSLYATLSGWGDQGGPRYIANSFFYGNGQLGILKVDWGAAAVAMFYGLVAFAILIWRTVRESQPHSPCDGFRSCLMAHGLVFLFAVVPCTLLLVLTLYAEVNS